MDDLGREVFWHIEGVCVLSTEVFRRDNGRCCYVFVKLSTILGLVSIEYILLVGTCQSYEKVVTSNTDVTQIFLTALFTDDKANEDVASSRES